MKTLLLYGEEDPRSSRLVAEELAAGIRGSKLVFLPGVGHQPNIEAAHRFTAEMRELFRATETSQTAC